MSVSAGYRVMQDPSAGELRTRVVIRPWQDESSGFASLTQVYGDPVGRWAKVIPAGAASYWGSKQVDTGITHYIVFRYLAAVSSEYVVEAKGERYRILRVKQPGGAKRWTWLECELLGSI